MRSKSKNIIFMCTNCGNEFSAWAGKCSACGEWNSLKEVDFPSASPGGRSKVSRTSDVRPLKLSEITPSKNNGKIITKISEFDRVLGGGIVQGSVTLIGGEPGIGKSTLLLQVAQSVPNTLYISAEESAEQIKGRADRLGAKNEELFLLSTPDIESVVREIEKTRPELVIIDSIQTIFMKSYESTAGSLVQVRECGILLQQLAKTLSIPIIIIGHVTKEGNLAGPRILEHIVDTVLYLEGERFNDARILRGVKNRFGPTNEAGIFAMDEKGMTAITNPSELFLGMRQEAPGSVVAVTMQGTRPILVEIQALVTQTHFGYPKRTSSGFDLNRLDLLAAVISKKTSINLGSCDIYLNVIGGIKLVEPAADLAVCAAIISSFQNKVYQKNACFFGEVGLLGEVRRVTRQSDREKEAKALGFSPQTVLSLGEITKKA